MSLTINTSGGGGVNIQAGDAILRVIAPTGSSVEYAYGGTSKTLIPHEISGDSAKSSYYEFIKSGAFSSASRSVTATLGSKTASADVVINGAGEFTQSLSYMPEADNFAFTGSKLFESTGDDWEVAFLTSGTLTLTYDLTDVDVFMVNAGSNGGAGASGDVAGGAGGDGGRYQTSYVSSISAGTYTVTVGNSSVATTSIADVVSVSSSASKKAGGVSGVGGSSGSRAAGAGSAGVFAFGDEETLIYSGRRYGSSGGGGGCSSINGAGQSGASGGSGGTGYTGGGAGSSALNTAGGSASANSGGGGGGAFSAWTGSIAHSSAGLGGSGIICIRPHRE